MIRRGSWFCSLFALLFLAGFAAADDLGTKPSDAKPADSAKLDEVAKNLGALQKQSEDTALLLKKMTEQLDKLAEANTAELKKLRDRLEKLEVDVVRLEGAADRGKKSFSIDPPAPQLPSRGTLKIQNIYTQPMSVWVDGVSYTLQPGEVRYVEHAAGSFTYEVPGVQENRLRRLAAGETFTIQIYGR